MTWLTLMMSLFSISASSAEITEKECGDKDFSDRFASVRDQGNSGFCYSFTAADLMGEALGVKPPDALSALYFGSQYISVNPSEVLAANRKIHFEIPEKDMTLAHSGLGFGGGYSTGNVPLLPDSTIKPTEEEKVTLPYRQDDPSGKPFLKREGGYVDLLLAHMLNQKKMCTENDVHSEQITPDAEVSKAGYFAVQLGYSAGGKVIEQFLKDRSSGKIDAACPLAALETPGQDLIKLKAKIQDFAADTARKTIQDKCTLAVNTDKLAVHSKSFSLLRNDESSAQYMMSVLNKDRPFAIHYNSCILKKCDAFENRAHASVVIGRTWDKENKTCLLKIRNSWGIKSGSCKDQSNLIKCKDGIWTVPVSTLSGQDNDVIWLEKNST